MIKYMKTLKEQIISKKYRKSILIFLLLIAVVVTATIVRINTLFVDGSNQNFKKQILILYSIFVVVASIFLLIKIDFKNFSVPKAILTIILILLTLEMVTFNLIRKINTDVVMVDYTASDSVNSIDPGETWDTTYEAKRSKFTSFEFFVEGEKTTEISIKIVNETNGEEYYNASINTDNIIIDRKTGKPAVEISCNETDKKISAFPLGKYHIYFTNTSKDQVINISVIEDSEGVQRINLSLIHKTLLGYKIALLVIMLISGYIIIICVYSKNKNFSVEKFFLVSIIPLAIAYFVLMPPWSVPDTDTHFLASYRLSNLLLGKDAWVGRVDDVNFYANVWKRLGNPDMGGFSSLLLNTSFQVENADLIAWPLPPTHMEYYSLLCYLPQVIGLSAGRLLGLGTVLTIYLGRLCMLTVYVLACLNAVKKTPVGKIVFAVVALLPMSLMMSSSISYDPLVLISTLNFIACTLKLYKEPDSTITLVECMIWAFVIGSVKGGGYLMILPIALILVAKNLKQSLTKLGLIIGSGIISIVLFDVILPAGTTLFQFGEEASTNFSASYAFANPLTYLHMCIETYLIQIDTLTINMGGNSLGWLEPTIPTVIIVGLMLITGIYSIYEEDTVTLKGKDKWIFSLVVFLTFFLTPIMLLSWTPKDYTTIKGLQGRYFLPVLPLIIIVLTKFKLHIDTRDFDPKRTVAIKDSCFKVCAFLSCIAVYYMLRLYLTR